MRTLLALVLAAAAVVAAGFLAEHPGHVEIVWQGRQIDTSLGVLVGAVALLVLLVALALLAAAALRRVPGKLRRRRAVRRRETGEAALTSGIVALAAGQAAEARGHARRAEALLGGIPMALLLAAEAAAREGDVAAAGRAYTALLARPETEFLGLRGLIGQALRAGDDATGRRLAERAAKLRPDALWLVDSRLLLAARAGDWPAARDTLANAAKRQVLPAEQLRHHQGVVLHELSCAAERSGDLREAATLAATAQALATDLAVPASHHARLLIGLGRKRAAARAIERAWRTAPHPDLARLYLEINPAAPPPARAASLQLLAAQNPQAAESGLALAEEALAARLWGEARRHLALAIAAPAPEGPSRRLCLLMARLEESEAANPQEGRAAAREWLDRALGAAPDPCYVCTRCGRDHPLWQALCAECGAFDTLRWQTPPHRVMPALAARAANAAAPPMLPAAEFPALPPSGLAPTPQWDNKPA